MPASSETCRRTQEVIRSSLKLDAGASFDDSTPLLGGEYDIDSLDILLIITNLEKEFGVRLKPEVVKRGAFATVGTLAELVESVGRDGRDR